MLKDMFFLFQGEKCIHSEKSCNITTLRRAMGKTGIHRECKTCEREDKNTPPVIEEGVIIKLTKMT